MLFNKGCCDNREPIMEPVITNCIEKEFYHEVKQV